MRSTIAILTRLTFAFICLVFGSVFDAQAEMQPQAVCNALLIPTVVQSSSDVRRIYSYVFVHAEEEYDRLRNMTKEAREAQASYKLFSAEYGESKTKEEFKEKISKRIVEEKIFSDVQEVTSYFRRGLEPFQAEEWSKCITATTQAGALMLSTRNESDDEFELVVTWVEPKGAAAESVIHLQATNGTLIVGADKIASTKLPFTSSGARSFIVSRGKSSNGVRIVANTPGFSDGIISNAPSKQPPAKVVRQCAEKEPCTGHSAVLACLPSRERPKEFGDVPPGTWWQGPASPGYEKSAKIGAVTTAIRYGKWSNSGCGLEGEGWHLRIGTCGQGTGESWQRCDSVKVEFPPANK
jgi:hypothetical protein